MAVELMRIITEAQGDTQRTMAGEYAHIEKVMRAMCHPDVLPIFQGTPTGNKLVKMIGDRLRHLSCRGGPDTFTDAIFLFTSNYKYPKNVESSVDIDEDPQ